MGLNQPVEERLDTQDASSENGESKTDLQKKTEDIHIFEKILKEENAANAEQLKGNFLKEEEKEFITGIEGINKINNLRDHLNPLLEDIKNTQTKINGDDQEGLKALDKFLYDCLQKNDIVQNHNKSIIQMLNKLDNGMGRDVNIDEKQIMLKSVDSLLTKDLDGRRTILNLEYKVDEKNTIRFKIGEKGIKVDDGNITILDKEGKDQYFNIVQDSKGGLKLVTNPDGLRAKLASYAVIGDAKEGATVTKDGKGYKVEMKNKIDDSLISFVLDENGGIGSNNTREQGDYKITINQKENTFNIIDQKAVEKKDKIASDAKTIENKEIGKIDFNTIVDDKIKDLEKRETDEANKKTPEGFKNAGEIQTQIKSLKEMKINYGKISEKTTAIDGKISDKAKEIETAAGEKKYDAAAKLAGERTALESQKSEIQKLELEMKKGAQEDKWDEVTKTWEKINAWINPEQANPGAVVMNPEAKNTSVLTAESVISKIEDPKLNGWNEKNTNSKLGAIITLLEDANSDNADIRAKKTELSDILAKGDMKAFQKKVGIKENETWTDGSSRIDGKLGKYTLEKTEKFLNDNENSDVAVKNASNEQEQKKVKQVEELDPEEKIINELSLNKIEAFKDYANYGIDNNKDVFSRDGKNGYYFFEGDKLKFIPDLSKGLGACCIQNYLGKIGGTENRQKEYPNNSNVFQNYLSKIVENFPEDKDNKNEIYYENGLYYLRSYGKTTPIKGETFYKGFVFEGGDKENITKNLQLLNLGNQIKNNIEKRKTQLKAPYSFFYYPKYNTQGASLGLEDSSGKQQMLMYNIQDNNSFFTSAQEETRKTFIDYLNTNLST